MTELSVFGRQPTTVFQLRGKSTENDATYAIGWAAANSATFLENLLRLFEIQVFVNPNQVVIALQESQAIEGFTDIEIRQGSDFHVIVEAKRGWEYPSLEQLKKYLPRFEGQRSREKMLVSMSAALRVDRDTLPNRLRDIRLIHLSWKAIADAAFDAFQRTRSFEEKLWLRHLLVHLQSYVTMQNVSDNSVYVLSLSLEEVREGKPYTFIDVVQKDQRYFHPIAKGWPKVPPNYLGFRFGGQLQSVHHVDSVLVTSRLSKENPNWKDYDGDYFVYTLGPPMKPPREMRTGAIYRSGRVWCAIDTLLSGAFITISDARNETDRRLALNKAR